MIRTFQCALPLFFLPACPKNKWGQYRQYYCGCKNGAVCDKKSGKCICKEMAKWGQDCTKNCDCRLHGNCVKETGACICDWAFQGPRCDQSEFFKVLWDILLISFLLVGSAGRPIQFPEKKCRQWSFAPSDNKQVLSQSNRIRYIHESGCVVVVVMEVTRIRLTPRPETHGVPLRIGPAFPSSSIAGEGLSSSEECQSRHGWFFSPPALLEIDFKSSKAVTWNRTRSMSSRLWRQGERWRNISERRSELQPGIILWSTVSFWYKT